MRGPVFVVLMIETYEPYASTLISVAHIDDERIIGFKSGSGLSPTVNNQFFVFVLVNQSPIITTTLTCIDELSYIFQKQFVAGPVEK